MSPSRALTMVVAGDFGTGNERAGAIMAAVVGLIGVVGGGLALARSRRTVLTG